MSDLIVTCACGWQTRGVEEEVVAETQQHGRALHNMAATREDVMAMAVPADEVTGPPPGGGQ